MRRVHPRERIARLHQRLQDLAKRLGLAQTAVQRITSAALQAMIARLYRQHPDQIMREGRLRLHHLYTRLLTGVRQTQHRQDQRVLLAVHRLDTLSPLATLRRGYAIIRRADNGVIVRDADGVVRGDEVQAHLAHGRLQCVVNKIETDD